jgi:hypothetical protein
MEELILDTILMVSALTVGLIAQDHLMIGLTVGLLMIGPAQGLLMIGLIAQGLLTIDPVQGLPTVEIHAGDPAQMN